VPDAYPYDWTLIRLKPGLSSLVAKGCVARLLWNVVSRGSAGDEFSPGTF